MAHAHLICKSGRRRQVRSQLEHRPRLQTSVPLDSFDEQKSCRNRTRFAKVPFILKFLAFSQLAISLFLGNAAIFLVSPKPSTKLPPPFFHPLGETSYTFCAGVYSPPTRGVFTGRIARALDVLQRRWLCGLLSQQRARAPERRSDGTNLERFCLLGKTTRKKDNGGCLLVKRTCFILQKWGDTCFGSKVVHSCHTKKDGKHTVCRKEASFRTFS